MVWDRGGEEDFFFFFKKNYYVHCSTGSIRAGSENIHVHLTKSKNLLFSFAQDKKNKGHKYET